MAICRSEGVIPRPHAPPVCQFINAFALQRGTNCDDEILVGGPSGRSRKRGLEAATHHGAVRAHRDENNTNGRCPLENPLRSRDAVETRHRDVGDHLNGLKRFRRWFGLSSRERHVLDRAIAN